MERGSVQNLVLANALGQSVCVACSSTAVPISVGTVAKGQVNVFARKMPLL